MTRKKDLALRLLGEIISSCSSLHVNLIIMILFKRSLITCCFFVFVFCFGFFSVGVGVWLFCGGCCWVFLSLKWVWWWIAVSTGLLGDSKCISLPGATGLSPEPSTSGLQARAGEGSVSCLGQRRLRPLTTGAGRWPCKRLQHWDVSVLSAEPNPAPHPR